MVTALAEFLGRINALEISALRDYLTLRIELEKKSSSENLSDKELFRLFEETVDLPEKLGAEKNVYFLIMLDEFQEASRFKKPFDFFHALRRHMQAQKRVSYVLCGSNTGMMEVLLRKHFGGHIPVEWLKPFSAEDSKSFLERRLKNLIIDDAALSELVDFTGGNPAYLNWFGELLSAEKKVTLPLVIKLEEKMFGFEGLRHVFVEELSRISRRKSKIFNVFTAMCRDDLSRPSEISKKLSRTSTVEVIIYLTRLEEKGFVRRLGEGQYSVVDRTLKEFVKRNVP